MIMTSIVSFANVHQLSTSDKLELKKPKLASPMKSMLHSPDSTNNNTLHQTPVTSMAPVPHPLAAVTTVQAAPRGRGRKANTAFVHVIPGQPVAVARRNARERNRVKQVNNGFSNLRQHIPFSARNKKMSKVETLKCAVEYIRGLQRMLVENGGYDGLLQDVGDLDLAHNVSSSSPVSSLESGEEHSLLSMSASDVMYETQQQHDSAPSSSTLLVDDYAAAEYAAHLRGGVILQTGPSRLYGESDVVFDDSPLPAHPNTLIRHGSSSLSPGYSDRSSVNNSPATGATASEVTTTGFMGVFAAAAAGLDKGSMMLDVSRGGAGVLPIFKKEALDMEGANTAEMMEALSWWEIEQARRMQQSALQQQPHQQQEASS